MLTASTAWWQHRWACSAGGPPLPASSMAALACWGGARGTGRAVGRNKQRVVCSGCVPIYRIEASTAQRGGASCAASCWQSTKQVLLHITSSHWQTHALPHQHTCSSSGLAAAGSPAVSASVARHSRRSARSPAVSASAPSLSSCASASLAASGPASVEWEQGFKPQWFGTKFLQSHRAPAIKKSGHRGGAGEGRRAGWRCGAPCSRSPCTCPRAPGCARPGGSGSRRASGPAPPCK